MPGAAALAAISALRAGAGKIAVATVAAIAPGDRAPTRGSTRHRDGRDRGRRHRRRCHGQGRGAARQGRCRADRPGPAGRGSDACLHAPRPQAGDARRSRRRCAGDGRRPRRPALRAHAAADAARRRDGAPHRRDQGSGERRPGTARARGGAALERRRRPQGRDDVHRHARRRLLAPRRRPARPRHVGLGRRPRRHHRRPGGTRRPLAQAAVWGIALHARAGALLAERLGPIGYLASELPAEVPILLEQLAH
jgi:hypothetical protein